MPTPCPSPALRGSTSPRRPRTRPSGMRFVTMVVVCAGCSAQPPAVEVVPGLPAAPPIASSTGSATRARDAAPAASSAPTPVASGAAPVVASAPAAVSVPPRAASGPGKIACGASLCDATKETCCQLFTEGVAPRCVLRVAEERGAGVSPPAWPLVVSCAPAGDTSAVQEVARCDDSGDCPKAQRCCRDHLGGEHLQRHCSAKACEFLEVCDQGAPCRTPGTRCDRGECRKVAQVACAGATCSGPESMCCTSERLTDYACRPSAACDPFFPRIECTGPADCPDGQDCELTQGKSATCRGGMHDIANTGVACRTDRDCARYACSGAKACVDVRPGDGQVPGVARVCACR